MKKILCFASALALLGAEIGSVQAQDDLVYVSVDPCRVVNTRLSSQGSIKQDTNRNFLVAGSAEDLSVQGGQVDCLNPKAASGQKPVAVAAYILAIPPTGGSTSRNGVLSVYPSDLPLPAPGSGSTVNFSAGQVIGNTTIVAVCSKDDCPVDGELAVLARNTDEHVIVDVQGYYYPATGFAFVTRDEIVGITTDSLEPTTVVSVKIQAPGSGFISLLATGWVDAANHEQNDTQQVECAIKLPSVSNRAPGQAINRVKASLVKFQTPPDAVGGPWSASVSSQGVHPVSAAGTFEFLFVCDRAETVMNIRDVTMTAQYHAANLNGS